MASSSPSPAERFIAGILPENPIYRQLLGMCPTLAVTNTLENALVMGAAVTFVMAVAAMVTWVIQYFILSKFGIEYLQTIAFILVIASLVQLVEMVIQKSSPVLYQSLGIFLPLITTNCAVLGLAVLNIQVGYSFLESVIFAIGAALGFTLAMVLMAGIRERVDLGPVPKCFQGLPIAFLTAGLMSLAFMGFAGLVKG